MYVECVLRVRVRWYCGEGEGGAPGSLTCRGGRTDSQARQWLEQKADLCMSALASLMTRVSMATSLPCVLQHTP